MSFDFAVMTKLFVGQRTLIIDVKINAYLITARRSYASAVLGVVIMSVRLSVKLLRPLVRLYTPSASYISIYIKLL